MPAGDTGQKAKTLTVKGDDGAEKVLNGFLKSPEFAQLAKEYGINP